MLRSLKVIVHDRFVLLLLNPETLRQGREEWQGNTVNLIDREKKGKVMREDEKEEGKKDWAPKILL